ncbi:MAG: uroporphyrinogen-III synthase [Sphingomonadales bacterium]|nr:uroporphyrinogen-III synthase [Sphingomonadales bacterium]
MSRVLILRPEPGAGKTAARARDMGLEPVVTPLFAVRSVEWEAPDAGAFDAVLLTSAHAARAAPADSLASLPCYTTGEATAEAARDAGFIDVHTGTSDGDAALALARRDGRMRVLHLCGRDHIELPGVERRIVYAADAAEELPETASEALAGEAVALIHSPRAAALFAALVGDRSGVRLALISAAAAEAAGDGWAAKAVAARPRDEALLEVAAKLCNIGAPGAEQAGR